MKEGVEEFCEFQSHNGAIAAFLSFSQVFQSQWFQSHNGAIAARLLLPALQGILLFQSHNGAIAAQPPITPPEPDEFVSIPQWCDCCAMQLSLKLNCFRVSIPQWCDCCSSL